MANSETIALIGVNHKTAPLELRERLAFHEGYEPPLASLSGLEELKEYYLLSTCNRVEMVFVCTDTVKARSALLTALFAPGISEDELAPHLYQYAGKEAVEHLFRVAASLDSMVVGEAQILGQLKTAYRAAARAKGTRLILNRLLHKAFSVAKRVRTETRIGASAVSISYAAVELGRKIFGDLTGKKALLIGAGEMAELAAEHLLTHGVSSVTVANRTLERAVALARRFHGQAVGLAEVPEQLGQVDVIISSTGAPELILRKEEVRGVMRGRRNRPLFFIDIAVPRDLDPAINELDNVYLYDIDDLQGVVDLNKADREREAVKAERIIAEEVLKFERWLENLETTPTIRQLQAQVEAMVRLETAKTANRLNLHSEADQAALDRMAQALANRLLANPLCYLKADTRRIGLQERIHLVRSVFALDEIAETRPEESPVASGAGPERGKA